jgi:OOP family OmpA-OmpF porin
MKKVLISCAISLAFITAPASAQWYVGAGVGSSNVTGVDGSAGIAPANLTGLDGNKTSSKFFGGYQITPNWGVEAQYGNLGSRSGSVRLAGASLGTITSKATQMSLAGTGTLPLASGFSLMGKIGLTSNKNNVTGAGSSGSDSVSGLLVGLGVSYNLTKEASLRLEIENFGKVSKDNGASGSAIRASNVSLGLVYAF